MVSLKLTRGKAEFVKRKLPSGEVEDVCLCAWNADFSVRGCIAQVPSKLIREVLQHNGEYAPGSIEEHRKKFNLDNRCLYCYAKGAGRGNWGKVTPKSIDEKTLEDFETFHPEIIRIGKNTECGHKLYKHQLTRLLDLCEEFDTQVIFPTKMLEFEEELAEQLKKIRGVLNYSITYDSEKIEPGIISQGYTNAWRIKQAEQYYKAGVNTTLTITCNLTQSILDNVKFDSAIELALKSHGKTGIPLRLLPLRIPSRKLALLVSGKQWGEIVSPRGDEDQRDLFNGEYLFRKRGNNEAYPQIPHEDFITMLNSGIGACGRIGNDEYCDACNLYPQRTVFPASELIQVEYNRDRKRRPEKKR
jgi:hypothetical protein